MQLTIAIAHIVPRTILRTVSCDLMSYDVNNKHELSIGHILGLRDEHSRERVGIYIVS